MRRSALAAGIVGALLLTLSPARADDRKSGRADRVASDRNWMMKAAEGGLAEVELGKLAQEKASSQAVKDFAARMVSDHSQANAELSDVAQKQNVTLPTSPGPKHQAEKDRLAKLSGSAFDKAYMQHMVMDHRKDVAEFKKEANHGSNPDVKAFASKTLPTLEEHLKMAEQTHSQLTGK